MVQLSSPAAFGNVHAPGTEVQRMMTICDILDAAKGGVATFNEAEFDQAYIKAAADSRGMYSFGKGELAMAYDKSLTLVGKWYVKISPGGYIGADGVKTRAKGDDDRRVGPSRGILIAVFYDPSTGISFFRFTSHDLAKAGTTHKWRQNILFSGWRRTGEVVNEIMESVPDGSGDGDKNWNARVDYPGTPDYSVPTPATFGNRIYDQINVWGDMKISGVNKNDTPSDHDMLSWTFSIDKQFWRAIPVVEVDITGRPIAIDTGHHAKPLSVRFGPGTRPPVRRPRMRRSRRWKRRHPVLWRRIKVWRRNNPKKGHRRGAKSK